MTNRKSYMSFRLVPKSVTLNDVILRYFSEFGQLPGALRKSSRSLSHLLISSCCSFILATSARPRVVQSATCPVRELAYPRVVQLPVLPVLMYGSESSAATKDAFIMRSLCKIHRPGTHFMTTFAPWQILPSFRKLLKSHHFSAAFNIC